MGAGVSLPDWPDRCRYAVPHAALTPGEELAAILRRERAQLDSANGAIAACARFYLTLKANLEGATQ